MSSHHHENYPYTYANYSHRGVEQYLNVRKWKLNLNKDLLLETSNTTHQERLFNSTIGSPVTLVSINHWSSCNPRTNIRQKFLHLPAYVRHMHSYNVSTQTCFYTVPWNPTSYRIVIALNRQSAVSSDWTVLILPDANQTFRISTRSVHATNRFFSRNFKYE